ncbi:MULTISPECIES: TetR/AcrR family transcriptional regulator [Paraburkholderia]|uniref:AcrR family transcriptional regulator n=1 Tax=Paraburkholderia graminis TaxID=60548 RepID=A0ABD5CLB8_9BURK|nr:TetR/AcrR family transcriptional regulator [Paraburkholderia graminis]MDQ0624896.1 AcrR family transcriptional regulator [Paraburkholderia graminis]MDR6206052.1 AcrR family transcriptional regulator [Paraburkholderia graminis]
MPTKRATTPAKQKERTKQAGATKTPTTAARKSRTEQGKLPRPVNRASRPDGAATRQHLLDIAGQVFAARGFADATSKEICERAGTPMASVNYHFGSREALYEAALVEAHRQVVSLDELSALTEGPGDARDKLRAVISRFVGLSTSSGAPWGFMLMLREVLSPSPAIPALIEKAVRPKATVLLGLIGEVLQLNPQEPAVQRALMFAVLPCIALMIAPRQMQAALLPAVAKDKNALVEDFICFVMAGLDAVAAAHRTRK